MSISHILILALVMIIVVPPEKLPEVMKNLGKLMNDIRRSTNGLWDEVKREAEFKPQEYFNPPANTQNNQPVEPQIHASHLNTEVTNTESVNNETVTIQSTDEKKNDGSKS